MKPSYMASAAALATIGMANAHIVAIGWTSLGGGTVEFKAMHWHDHEAIDGYLLFDGVQWPFTGEIHDTPVISGFDGALVNSEYATFNSSTGTINAIRVEDDWLTVTVTGVTPGSHTLGSSDIALTQWTLEGGIETFEFDFTAGGDSSRLTSSALRSASITTARTVSRDVGTRLSRLRSGVQSEPVTTTQAPAGGSKGGMAKEPITISRTCPWEVYGELFYVTEDYDAQYRYLPGGTAAPVRQLLMADTSVDVFGGTVGVEYDFTPNWSAGFAISGANSDVDMALVGGTDVDTLALMPYVSYRQEVGAGMLWYADLLFAYGMNDYSTFRVPGAIGSTDGDFYSLDFNTGLNLRTGDFVHGPYGQIRWLDGDIDGYTEVGPGAGGFADADYESLATQLGYQVSYPMALAGGTLVPQARAGWEHEFEEDQGTVGGIPLGALDEDLAVLGAGIGWYVNCGWNVVLDYEARLGSDSQSHYVGLKAGREF